MTRKRTVRKDARKGGNGTAYWKLVATIAVAISVGLLVKLFFFQPRPAANPVAPVQASSPEEDTLKWDLWLVASKFRCACGGCRDLPLNDCTCNMPRGALEEKAFIRDKLHGGLSVVQVIDLVDKKYGHKST